MGGLGSFVGDANSQSKLPGFPFQGNLLKRLGRNETNKRNRQRKKAVEAGEEVSPRPVRRRLPRDDFSKPSAAGPSEVSGALSFGPCLCFVSTVGSSVLPSFARLSFPLS
jgi:hypothetical protein